MGPQSILAPMNERDSRDVFDEMRGEIGGGEVIGLADIAEAMLDGEFCCECGTVIDFEEIEHPGFPHICGDCVCDDQPELPGGGAK